MSLLDKLIKARQSQVSNIKLINGNGFRCSKCNMFHVFPNIQYQNNSRDVECCGITYKQGDYVQSNRGEHGKAELDLSNL